MKKSGLLIVSLLCMFYQNMMPASMKLRKADELLLNAIEDRDIDLIKSALAMGANSDAQDSYGYTALMLSVRNDWISAMKLLLQAGANVGYRNMFGFTALFYVESEQVVNLLIDAMHVESEKLIKIMTEQGLSEKDQREELIKQGLSIDSQNNDKKVALMHSISMNKFNIALRIIDLGADVDMQDCKNKKALNFILLNFFMKQRCNDFLPSQLLVVVKKLKKTKNFEQILSRIISEVRSWTGFNRSILKLDKIITEINEENQKDLKYLIEHDFINKNGKFDDLGQCSHLAQYARTLNIPNIPVEILLNNLLVDGPIRLPSKIAEEIISQEI